MASEHHWNAQDLELARQLHRKMQSARHGLGIDFSSDRRDRSHREFIERWIQRLSKAKAVSVDIFDTALVRCFLDPDDVFLFLKGKDPFAALPMSCEQIHEFRKQAERDARLELRQQTGSVEVTLDEIYAKFVENAGLNHSKISALVDAERSVELAACRAHPLIQQLIQQAVDQGKELLFVSDTFHPRDFLYKLLTQSDYHIEPDHIFASCDYREGKYSGRLLLAACKALNFAPNEVVHLGDNATSDEQGARSAGMHGLLHPYAISRVDSRRHHALPARRTESILQGTALAVAYRPHEKAFWFQLGCEVFGPLLTSFTLWLIAQWRRDKIERVFFLLRDGLILRQIYELFRESRPDLPPSEFLCSSRRAFAVPALGCGQTRDIDSLLVSGNPRPAGEFLSRLDLNPDQFTEAFKQAGFHSADDIVDHRGDPIRILHLFRNKDVLTALSRRALYERKMLVRYLEQQMVTGDRATAIVDVGWNNTVQKSLLAVLDHEKINHNLHGYYLGTFGGAQDFQLRDYRYQSYLCHDGEPLALSEPVASCRVLLEIVCTSFEGSLRSFNKSGGKIEPLLDPPDMTAAQTAILHAIHEGIIFYAQSLADNPLGADLGEIPAETAADNLLRLISRPSPQEAEQIGFLEHGDGVGSLTRKPLATFGHNSLDPQDLLDSYRNAYWKQGLLAMDTVQSMALRQLIAPMI